MSADVNSSVYDVVYECLRSGDWIATVRKETDGCRHEVYQTKPSPSYLNVMAWAGAWIREQKRA